MKRIATMALMLHLGVAGLYAQDAQERSANVRMTFSGTMLATTINLQANTITDDVNLAGDGSLGPFTFRELHADTMAPPQDPPATCAAPLLFFRVASGAGVLRIGPANLYDARPPWIGAVHSGRRPPGGRARADWRRGGRDVRRESGGWLHGRVRRTNIRHRHLVCGCRNHRGCGHPADVAG